MGLRERRTTFMSEVRTQKGKPIGMVDARTRTLYIKDGKKTTMIEIPTNELKIRFVSGNGATEEVYITAS
jgi:hypothetical protein